MLSGLPGRVVGKLAPMEVRAAECIPVPDLDLPLWLIDYETVSSIKFMLRSHFQQLDKP